MLQNIELGNHDEHPVPLLKKPVKERDSLCIYELKANPRKTQNGFAGSNYFGSYIQASIKSMLVFSFSKIHVFINFCHTYTLPFLIKDTILII
jgi:hypothetical protein